MEISRAQNGSWRFIDSVVRSVLRVLHSSHWPLSVRVHGAMSTSKPPDIVQEGEKNPRGIPKALFIVRSRALFFRPRRVSKAHSLIINHHTPFIAFAFLSILHVERRGGISWRSRRGRRKGSLCVPGCLGVRISKSVTPCTPHSHIYTWPFSTCLSPSSPPPSFCDAFCRKYRYMDSNLTQRKRGLEEKIPDIRKTLNMVEFLRDRRVRTFTLPGVG